MARRRKRPSQKILAEAKAASALDHPNIAKLHTCGYKDFTVFMTAEFR